MMMSVDANMLVGDLAKRQRRKLGLLLGEILGRNPFYTSKLSGIEFDPANDLMDALPFTVRKELEAGQAEHGPYGTNLTYPLERYCRYHQTSGSGGRPLRWVDTAQSWAWFRGLWGVVLGGAGVKAGDRVCFPFSFGPFIGFWGGFEACVEMGCLTLPAGGMASSARLKMIMDNEVGTVCCTPTYALHLMEVAREEKIDLAKGPVRKIIVAGEPGGSVPAIKRRLELGWNAKVFDHHGMTEMGAVSFTCEHGGVHLIEDEFIAEVIDPVTKATVAEGELGELVLTNLGRWGSPLIRYRTGDQVRIERSMCACGRPWARLDGGILGRVDDMFTVRGNNVFPSAIEAIIRRFEEIVEFRIELLGSGALAEVRIIIEPAAGADERIGQRLGHTIHDTLLFKAQVETVGVGTLPRFELKAKRFVRK